MIQAGHPELLASYYQPLVDYAPWARIWARALFNCSGLAFPTGIAPFGNPADSGGWNDNGQRSNGLFAALHFSSEWLYLRQQGRTMQHDFVAETVDFWLDYLHKVTAQDALKVKGLVPGEYVALNDCFQELCGVPVGYDDYACTSTLV